MTKQERVFIERVWSYYNEYGRHNLDWRKTTNPYRIVVSEVMLQQTQVERVIPKYRQFLKQFPTVQSLAAAPLSAVLIAWQGLGYNRRAKMLHECARAVVSDYGGKFPISYSELLQLPGIGRYTAGAVLAFAFNRAEPIVETNIRSVYLHSFFKDKTAVTDAEIVRVIVRTLDHTHPRQWYYALMDYGAHLKKTFGNPNKRSVHYRPQSRFQGSNREIRGAILRLLAQSSCAKRDLYTTLNFESHRIEVQISTLIGEGLLTQKGDRLYLSR